MNADTREPLAELHDLLALLHEDELTPEQEARIEQLVAEDISARRYYLEMMFLYGHLQWKHRSEEVANTTDSPSSISNDPPVIADPQTVSIVLDGSSLPTVSNASFSSFVGSWMFANLFALLVMGLGVLGAWLYQIDIPQPMAELLRPTAGTAALSESGSVKYVGQITGMANVHWADESTAALGGARVPLGRQYALAAGLMEITYDSGAKVTLQGPVLYKVESAESGFLTVGKLTARLDKKLSAISDQQSEKVVSGQWSVASKEGSGVRGQGSEKVVSGQWLVASQEGSGARGQGAGKVVSGQWSGASKEGSGARGRGSENMTSETNPKITKSQISNPQSQIPASASLFTIHTPTTSVTDLGTEFGVEVDRDGNFEVHVLQGQVKTDFHNAAGKTLSSVILTAGEARRRDHHTAQVTSMAARPAMFSKIHFLSSNDRYQRWLAYSKQLRNDPSLVAYYSFESMGKATSILPNVSAAGEQLNGEVIDAEWVNGRFPEKAALFFHGDGANDHVVLPQHERFNFTGPFSVAVWFKAKYFTHDYQTLAAKGDSAWRLHRNWTWNTLSFHVNYGPETEYHCTWTNSTPNSKNAGDNRWHLAAAIFDPIDKVGHMKLFLDGRLDAEGESPLPLSRNNEPVWLGNNSRCSDRAFPGLIDEVAIFNRAISSAEIEAMFKAGNPAPTAGN